MPGFPAHRRFALVRLDEDGVLCALRSLDDPELRFLVVPPHAFFPEYAPVIDDATASELGVTRAEDVLLLSVLTAGPSLADTSTRGSRGELAPRRTGLEGDEAVLAERKRHWTPPKKQFDKGWLQIYRRNVSSLAHGAVLIEPHASSRK